MPTTLSNVRRTTTIALVAALAAMLVPTAAAGPIDSTNCTTNEWKNNEPDGATTSSRTEACWVDAGVGTDGGYVCVLSHETTTSHYNDPDTRSWTEIQKTCWLEVTV